MDISECAAEEHEKRERRSCLLTLRTGRDGEKIDSLFSVSDASSQDCYDTPRTFPSDRSSSLEGFHNHFVSIIDLGIINCISLSKPLHIGP